MGQGIFEVGATVAVTVSGGGLQQGVVLEANALGRMVRVRVDDGRDLWFGATHVRFVAAAPARPTPPPVPAPVSVPATLDSADVSQAVTPPASTVETVSPSHAPTIALSETPRETIDRESEPARPAPAEVSATPPAVVATPSPLADEPLREGTESVRPSSPPSFEGEAAQKLFGLENDAIDKVFRHIERFGSISEHEVTTILGSPRAFRRFSSEFERYASMVPFRVGIEMGASGKRYVKEGSR